MPPRMRTQGRGPTTFSVPEEGSARLPSSMPRGKGQGGQSRSESHSQQVRGDRNENIKSEVALTPNIVELMARLDGLQ